MIQVHSVSARAVSEPCEVLVHRPPVRLRPYVAGYGGFHAVRPLRRRVLPISMATLVVDFAGPSGLVTGPRGTPLVYDRPGWQHGVAIGLTPAGVAALLRMPMPELVNAAVPLEDLLGRRAGRLAERLRDSPDWTSRFALLDDRLTAWLDPDRAPDGPVTYAWWRLQSRPGRVTVGGLAAELGVSRRFLQAGFQRQIGLPPKTVARIARFQRAVRVLSVPSATFDLAVACGYADQPHSNREIRAMAGVTPTELRVFLQ